MVLARRMLVVTGLEHAVNISQLELNSNPITDLTPLDSLVSLTRLYLNDNSITDVTALATLTSLASFHLNGNPIDFLSDRRPPSLHRAGAPSRYRCAAPDGAPHSPARRTSTPLPG